MGVGGQQMNRSAGQCLQCFDESRGGGGGNKLHGMSAGEKVRGGGGGCDKDESCQEKHVEMV